MHIHAHTCKHTRAVSAPKTVSRMPAAFFAGYIVTATTLTRSQLSLSVSTFRCVFFQDHCPKGSYGQIASHQPSLYSSSEQQGFRRGSLEQRPLSSLGRGEGGLRPGDYGRPRVSWPLGWDVDRPCLLLQRLPVHLPGQENKIIRKWHL